jgi:hypothetical protein
MKKEDQIHGQKLANMVKRQFQRGFLHQVWNEILGEKTKN